MNDRAVDRIGGLDATAMELDPRTLLIPTLGLRCGPPWFTIRGRDCVPGMEMTDSICRAGELDIPPRGGTETLEDLVGLLVILGLSSVDEVPSRKSTPSCSLRPGVSDNCDQETNTGMTWKMDTTMKVVNSECMVCSQVWPT